MASEKKLMIDNNSQPNNLIKGGETKVMKTKKAFNVMTSAALVASLGLPAAASAAGSVTATNVPNISESGSGKLGTIRVELNEGTELREGDVLIVKLPSDVDLDKSDLMDTTGNNRFDASRLNSVLDDVYLKLDEALKTDEDEFQFKVVSTSTNSSSVVLPDDISFYIHLGNVVWKDLDSGPVEATLTAPSGSPFPTGKVTIANVRGDDEVEVSVTGLDQDNDDFAFALHIKETTAGSLKPNHEIELELPDGFEWDKDLDDLEATVTAEYGNNAKFKFFVNKDELTIRFLGADTDGDGDYDDPTKDESYWIIENILNNISDGDKNDIRFVVEDENNIDEEGDIIAKVSGDPDLNVSELKVGTYGDYGSSAEAVGEIPTLIAGKSEQVVADIKIKESLGESLVQGRTVTLTLPEGAVFQKYFEDPEADNDPHDGFDNKEGLRLEFDGYQNDGRTAKFKVTQPSKDPGEFILEDVEIALRADFEGDLEIELGGSSGISGTVKVAEVVNPVEASAEKAQVRIGVSDQATAELTIKEKVAGAFEKDGKVVLNLPDGVEFVGTPKVEVTEGDLEVSNIKISDDAEDENNIITFDVDDESSKASTIKISGITLKVDRTVPEGDINLEIGGTALVETAKNTAGTFDDWENSDSVAEVAIAEVITPAPDDAKTTATFTIDSTTYTVDGEEKALDVAPFVENGRTYLPVRYVAEAVGVTEDNIIWNSATRTVTLIKGDRIAQVKIGSKVLTINGVNVQMDVEAKVKDGRTVLPLRYVAQALGANVTYDEVSKTVTVEAN
ncbi:copper amine oxidase N-terminal domain-containing protein [Bacillaceae bacterium]